MNHPESSSRQANKKGIAIFDFDGTIIGKDSFIEFLRFTHGTGRLLYCYFYNSIYTVLYFLKLYPNYKLKERYFSFFYKGKEVEKLKKLGADFSLKLDDQCYPYAKEVLKWHKDKGHDILILSASSEIWLGDWCNRHGYLLMNTKFEENNGRFTGKIEGKNCHGEEKLRRIEGLLKDYDFNETYGYGDSKADLFFLHKTRHMHYASLEHRKEYKINVLH